MKSLLALALLLTACGGHVDSGSTNVAAPPPDGAAPLVAADGAQPNVAPTLVASSPADGSTSAGFTSDITLTFSTAMDPTSTISAVTVAPSVTCTGSVTGATYSCAHAALAPSTQYTVIVHATATGAGGIAIDGEHSFSFTTAQAGVTNVAVLGATSNEVRQGNGVAHIMLTGNGLAGVSAATLGTLPATLGTGTDTSLAITVMVTHGLQTGPLDLSLVTAGGTIKVPSAVVVTSIHAAAGTGDDTSGGTTSAPFATLTHALSVAGSGDTISLADGTYSAGETWPAAVPPSFVNVPDGVKIVGSSTTGTILTPATGSQAGLDALVFTGTSGATDLTISGFQRGVVVTGGAADLERVHIYDNTLDGVYAQNNAYVGMTSSEIDTNGNAGLVGADTSSLAILSTYVHGNTTGAYLSGSAELDPSSGTRFEANGHTLDKTNSGVFLTGAATMTFVASASANAAAGIYSESTGTLSVEGSTDGNGTASGCGADPACSGIVVAGAQTAMLSAESSSNGCAGVTVMGPPKTVTMTSMTMLSNRYTNLWVEGTGSLLSTVSVTSSRLSDADIGVFYGNFVTLSVSSTTITSNTTDLESEVSAPDSANTFLNCTFGTDLQPHAFPATTGTITESSQMGSATWGPSWQVDYGSVLGAPFVLQHS